MPEADRAVRRHVPLAVTDPERIPAARYYDAEFYQAEADNLWPHVRQMACRLEQIPNVGDWIEYQNLGKSVIVVRTDEGVKAFHNACRHRDVPIAGGKGNAHGNCKSSGFVCPFHGWRFDINGENTGSLDAQERRESAACLTLDGRRYRRYRRCRRSGGWRGRCPASRRMSRDLREDEGSQLFPPVEIHRHGTLGQLAPVAVGQWSPSA
jgi:nitrite reductase/ring-hydroxylating ferredoxin subunit